MIQGKLIVLDGTDGSGKGTQQLLLAKRLKEEGYQVETISFPQYGARSCGPVEEYLNGGYGSLSEVSPYIAALFYMIDRYGVKAKLQAWLNEGKIVISDRYAISNLGHQGANILDDQKRLEFFDWLKTMEYSVFKNPQPDKTFILHVSVEISLRLIDQKKQRGYIKNGGKRDILEADTEHLRRAEAVYSSLPDYLSNTELIECAPAGELLAIEEIHGILYNKVKALL